MRVLVLGATGGTGMEIVRQAIARAMKSRHSFDQWRNLTFMPIA
jgi:uncharacterized protein YbjT (DUF2867 family)